MLEGAELLLCLFPAGVGTSTRSITVLLSAQPSCEVLKFVGSDRHLQNVHLHLMLQIHLGLGAGTASPSVGPGACGSG